MDRAEFAVFVGVKSGLGDCNKDYVTDSSTGDISLIAACLGLALLCCIFISLATYMPCIKRKLIGEDSLRIYSVARHRKNLVGHRGSNYVVGTCNLT